MINLETERLRVISLNKVEFENFLYNMKDLESDLKVKPLDCEIDDIFIEIMTEVYDKVKNDIENLNWYCPWQIILKEKNTIIGSAGFKGKPKDGIVELGYGLYDEKYESNGYMTESIGSITKWAFSQAGIVKIVAETDNDNKKSHRVLEKTYFKVYKKLEDKCWWELKEEII